MKRDYKRDFYELLIIVIILFLVILGIAFNDSFFYQLAFVALVIELIIRRVTGKILYHDIKKSLREIMGMTDPNSKVFPELMKRIEENEFHIINRKVIHNIKYSKPSTNKFYNLYSKVVEEAEIIPRMDNIYFTFKRMIPEDIPPPKLMKIECIENDIKEEFDLNDKHSILPYREGPWIFYKILKPLKKNHRYKIIVISLTSPSLSDLSSKDTNCEEDWIGCELIMPTQKLKIVNKFPFDINKYTFHIIRQNFSRSNIQNITHQNVEYIINKNTIIITQENLDKGDFIKICYRKK